MHFHANFRVVQILHQQEKNYILTVLDISHDSPDSSGSQKFLWQSD